MTIMEERPIRPVLGMLLLGALAINLTILYAQAQSPPEDDPMAMYTAAAMGAKAALDEERKKEKAPVQCPSALLKPGDPCLFLTPWNWMLRDNEALSSSAGAYLKVAWTGGDDLTVKLHIGSSLDPNISARVPRLFSNGIPAPPGTTYPLVGAPQMTLGYSVDKGPFKTVDVLLSEKDATVTLDSVAIPGLMPPTAHSLVVKILSISGELDRWGINGWQPQTSLRLLSVDLPLGAHAVQPAVRPRRALFFGDSITEGFFTRSCDTSNLLAANAAHRYWASTVASAMDAEYSIVGFGDTGWTVPSDIGNVPAFTDTFSWHWAGAPRVAADVRPDLVVVNLGTNDVLLTGLLEGNVVPSGLPEGVAAGVSRWATGMRAMFGTDPFLFALMPFGGDYPSADWIVRGAALYHELSNKTDTVHVVPSATVEGGLSVADTRASIDVQYGLAPMPKDGVFDASCDGIHPNSQASMELGAVVSASIARVFHADARPTSF